MLKVCAVRQGVPGCERRVRPNDRRRRALGLTSPSRVDPLRVNRRCMPPTKGIWSG